MFAALTENALAGIQVVREFIARHEELQMGRRPASRLEMKRYSVSSCVTRLYAIYENFVESLVSDYLDVIPDICSFADLSESMRKEYRNGISHLLSRLDGPRYGHLDHANLIRWYHEALTAHNPYRFIAEALTRHDGNLRLTVLASMLKRVQVDDLPGWLSHHEAIMALFTEPAGVLEQVESELQNFIQLRNDAAHGALVTLPGNETLQRYCDLVGALVLALGSYLYRETVLWRHRVGKARLIGRVTEVFQHANAFIVPVQPGQYVALNETVHIVGPWSCMEASISSIQVDDEPTEGIGAFAGTVEVGVQASTLPRRHVELYADT